MFREIFWIKDLSCPECHAALTKTDEEVRYESDHTDVYFCHHCKLESEKFSHTITA